MGHTHHHDHDRPLSLPPAFDLSIPDSELTSEQLTRRGLLRRAGMLGAGAAAASVLGTAAAGVAHADDRGGYEGDLRWLAGDHHIHTQYSGDGIYRVVDQAGTAGPTAWTGW
jgi:hypothetical protein